MFNAAQEFRHAMAGLADSIAAVLEERDQLKAKLDTANALVTCCCGNPVDSHGMGDGHSPVDMYHHAHVRLTDHHNELTALVKILLDNDPGETISDGGHTVLDMWRQNARELLRAW